MNNKATLLALALATLSFTNAPAYAGNVASMSITGGSFILCDTTGCVGGSTGSPILFGSGYTAGNIIGGDRAFGSPFTYLGVPFYIFNSNEGASNTYAPYGGTATVGGDANSISATISGSTITADLSGWTGGFNSNNLSQGVANATGTVDAAGNYTLSWSSPMVGGPFSGYTSNWTISGVAAVPEPSTYGMMLVGLGLVAAAAAQRRRSY